MQKNLLDLMTEEERKRVKARAHKRRERGVVDVEISPEIYMVAEFGYYYGWQAVQAVRNNEISLTEMYALNEAARKVWYNKLVENSRASMVATASAMAGKKQDAVKSFDSGMKPFKERARLEE